MTPFLLVKILDRMWAEKLLDGEVFMRPLSSFGDRLDPTCANEFRGDLLEGLSQSFRETRESTFFRDAIGVEQSQPTAMGYFAECFRHEKLYCLYRLEYSDDHSTFIAPDRRLLDFGDTAVVIVDTLAFMRGIVGSLRKDYGDTFWFGAKRVDYSVDLSKTAVYDEFSKASTYSWQNEYRIAIDLSDGCIDQQSWDGMTDFARLTFMNQGGRVHRGDEREPITVKIGDIRNACIVITTSDLVDLRLPFDRLTNISVPPDLVRPRRPRATSFKPIIRWS